MTTTDRPLPPGVVDLAAARAARGVSDGAMPPAFPPAEQPELIEPRTTIVDPAAPKHPARPTGTPRPVVPAWISDRETAVATARWATQYGARVLAFHGL